MTASVCVSRECDLLDGKGLRKNCQWKWLTPLTNCVYTVQYV